MPSTRKRPRSASPSRRIKHLYKTLEGYYKHIQANPHNEVAVRRGEKFMEESFPMLAALVENGRDRRQKNINNNAVAQETMNKMRKTYKNFWNNPHAAIGQTPKNLSRRSSPQRYRTMFPKGL